MLLQDIRNYEDVRLLFTIGVAACVVDTAGLFLFRTYPKDASISKWYDDFGLVAYMLDVSSIIIGVLIAQQLYPLVSRSWSPLLFCAVVVFVQQVHDIVFGLFVVPNVEKNRIFDLLQAYVSNSESWKILIADGVIVVLASLLAMVLYGQKTWVSIYTLIVTLYITGYALYIHA
jgi:hypothetical protein